jgi:hypothetical protein
MNTLPKGPVGCVPTSNHAHDYRLTKPDGSPLPYGPGPGNDHSEQRAIAKILGASFDLLARAKASEILLVHAFGEPPLLQPPGDRERRPTLYAAWDEIRELRRVIAKAEGRS